MKMSTELELNIVRDGKIAGYFVKANKEIVENNQNFLNESANQLDLLLREWQVKYNASLVLEHDIITKIKFETYQDKMIFLLKFN